MKPRSVELLWWRECPSWERALAILREEAEGAGLDPASIRVTEVRDQIDAERLAFHGSPTIRIDDQDVAGSAEGPIGLTCRIYRRADGRVSPLPDPEQIRTALRRAERNSA